MSTMRIFVANAIFKPLHCYKTLSFSSSTCWSSAARRALIDLASKCSKLLESCKFTEFWTAVGAIEGDDMLKNLVKNSTQKMQSAILGVLALTYKSASVAKVSEALNGCNAEAISKLNHPSVESVEGDKVIFVASSENTKRNRVFQEGVDFGAIASMMAKVTAE